jgi:hypothetical protein
MKKALLMVLAVVLTTAWVNAQQDSTYKEYTGRYVFPAGSPAPDATVTQEGTTLYISSVIGSATLSRVEADVFSIVEYNGTATFRRSPEGKVTGIHVVVADLDLTGTREVPALLWWRPSLLFKY